LLINLISKKSKGHTPLFFGLAFAIFCVQALFFFCSFLRSCAFNSFAIFGVSLRQHLPDLKSGTRPGFEKLLDRQSKKRGAVAPLVGVGHLT